MTERTNAHLQSTEPIWEFIPAVNYKIPSPPIAYRVKGGIAGLWQKLKPSEKKPSSPLTEEDQLETLSDRFKHSLVPKPDWSEAASALTKTLTNAGNGNSHQHIAYVTPPYSAGDLILKGMAEQLNRRLIAPPSAEQILAGDLNWLKPLTTVTSPWILPNLEKCYLRHHRGLTLIRSFFALIQTDRVSPGIIGCASWAWAYFERIMPEMLPAPITLQAFDHQRLTHWLRKLIPCIQEKQIRFRQTDNGIDVLPLLSHTDADAENAFPPSQFIKYLAAYSRGIPGIAESIWGNALLSLPGNKEKPEQIQDNAPDYHKTIWLPPWEQLNLPKPGASVVADQKRVLHNLLLHNGLTDSLLPQILPLNPSECNRALASLEKEDLITYDKDEWRISAKAYPAVRQFLKENGYLTDSF